MTNQYKQIESSEFTSIDEHNYTHNLYDKYSTTPLSNNPFLTTLTTHPRSWSIDNTSQHIFISSTTLLADDSHCAFTHPILPTPTSNPKPINFNVHVLLGTNVTPSFIDCVQAVKEETKINPPKMPAKEKVLLNQKILYCEIPKDYISSFTLICKNIEEIKKHYLIKPIMSMFPGTSKKIIALDLDETMSLLRFFGAHQS